MSENSHALEQLRKYLLWASLRSSSLCIQQESAEKVQADFINSRKESPDAYSEEQFHMALILSKFVSLLNPSASTFEGLSFDYDNYLVAKDVVFELKRREVEYLQLLRFKADQ